MSQKSKKPNDPNRWGSRVYRIGKRLSVGTIDPMRPQKVYWNDMIVDLPPINYRPPVNGMVEVKRNIASKYPWHDRRTGKLRPNCSNVYRFTVPIHSLFEAVLVSDYRLTEVSK